MRRTPSLGRACSSNPAESIHSGYWLAAVFSTLPLHKSIVKSKQALSLISELIIAPCSFKAFRILELPCS